MSATKPNQRQAAVLRALISGRFMAALNATPATLAALERHGWITRGPGVYDMVITDAGRLAVGTPVVLAKKPTEMTFGELLDMAYDNVTDNHLHERLSDMAHELFALTDMAYGDRLYAVPNARRRLDDITREMRYFLGDVFAALRTPEHAHRNLPDDMDYAERTS